DEEEFRRNPARTAIPGFIVDAVVHAPLGAFPGECYGLYETSFEHFDEYVAAINARGLDAVLDYVDRFVYQPATHQDYLALFDPEMLPGRLPISTNEMRAAHRASMLTGITDTFLYAQRGFLDVGFIGGAQVDRFGNVNSSVIGDFDQPKVRLPGSGGANDIVS